MDVFAFVQYMQLMDILVTAIGILAFLGMAGRAFPEVNQAECRVPVKASRPGEHRAYRGHKLL
jgi:hypothetical protein